MTIGCTVCTRGCNEIGVGRFGDFWGGDGVVEPAGSKSQRVKIHVIIVYLYL